MNVLVIFAHPDVDNGSIGNKIVLDEIKKVRGVEVRELYKLYPDFKIDVEAEQQALLRADIIIFQFPFYWYNVPALLKEWQDAVLEYGFAYGSTGTKLHGKELLVSTTIGGPRESYEPGGYNTFPVDQFLTPIKQLCNLTGLKFLDNYVVTHSVLNIPGLDYKGEDTEAAARGHADRLLTIIHEKLEEKMSKPVYFIGQVNVKDFDVYMSEYGMPVVQQLLSVGAEILSATFDTEVLEGEWGPCWTVLFKFPDETVLKAWWKSEEYAPFKDMRITRLTNGGNVAVLPEFDPASLGM